MAQIENPYQEIVENHTTEEVLVRIEQMLASAQGAAIKARKNENVAYYESAANQMDGALQFVKALNHKLGNVDRSATIVA